MAITKRWTILLVAGWLAMWAGTAVAATVQDVFREALAAYNAGDLAGAKAKLELVLATDPSHPAARAYLKRIEIEEKRPRSIEQQVAAITLTGINFRDATLDSVLAYLTSKAAETSGDTINFVSKLPRDQMQSRRVSLTFANPLPMTEVLRYIGELANVKFRYEPHAIVVEDAASPASSTP